MWRIFRPSTIYSRPSTSYPRPSTIYPRPSPLDQKANSKNSISYRGSIAWNLLEPPAVSARDYAKRAKSLTPPETWTLMKSHRKWAVPKLTVISYFIDPIHIFYCTNYFPSCWPHSYFSVNYILTLVYFFIVFRVFLIFIILLTFFTQLHKLY